MPSHSKVVIDSSASQVLLALAYREGLLTESENNDQCLRSLGNRKYPDWLVIQALQQVVLFEQVHLALPFAWRGVRGELVESGPFFPIPERIKSEGNVEQIDAAILNGVLKARGISPTPFEDATILQQVDAALKALEEWQKKYGEEPPSSFEIGIKRIFSRQRSSEPKYVELERIRIPLNAFQPVARALEEYLEVVATAEDRAAFVMTPVYNPDTYQLFQPKMETAAANAPTALLRLTSAKLGVLPFGHTLAETLKLAKDPATTALRVKIQEWTNSLTNDLSAETERIQKEIAGALSHLKTAKIGANVSNATTYLGVPMAWLGDLSPFFLKIGLGCTIAGTIGLTASDMTKKKYRWASFGASSR